MMPNHDEELAITKRRKELFGDCALVEIIHLHDCLRGALRALHADVDKLAAIVKEGGSDMDLEKKVAGRFTVIWSVFRAHSQAEDQFIWPKLREKTHQGPGSPKQKEYEDDHADEDRMFGAVDELLSKLSDVLRKDGSNRQEKLNVVQSISKRTEQLTSHLMDHLEKEETQCLPLVVKHLSKTEIVELVGLIMGRRSADTIANIMTMAVQNLAVDEREEMIKYMKQSMENTFFDQWLRMSGWMAQTGKGMFYNNDEASSPTAAAAAAAVEDSDALARTHSEDDSDRKRPATAVDGASDHDKRSRIEQVLGEDLVLMPEDTLSIAALPDASTKPPEVTSPTDLEKLIRAVASNPHLTAEQKNQTIQSLRDSVYRERERHRHEEAATIVNNPAPTVTPAFFSRQSGPQGNAATTGASAATRSRRVTPPSMYYQKTDGGTMVVWNGQEEGARLPGDASVPLFSAAELAPTYHDGAAATVLGCPHYARGCKLRHPKSGRLYTCRLCCDQQREIPLRDQDEPLDRYAVSEIMCMHCCALQPSNDRCINPDCESRGRPFARYFCRICNLFDDNQRDIFHCPYCNICRLGKGLGIDFRHCMRCNACVSLTDEEHRCIPQKLQGDCPICHEQLFQSTEPLRGLKCGHVMHMSCYTEYRRHSHTCPLCHRSMEEMKELYSLLDNAIRMQPMPAAYLSTVSSIYCQDCCETGQAPYHFVGLKCKCGSYNTRELGRVTRGS